jgi:DNA-binding CsgD family transcriptional regulator
MYNPHSFSPDFCYENVETIKDVKFTHREIDIIACLISGRSVKAIALFLSINPRTVETHVANIARKTSSASRDGIISFIEKSGKYELFKNQYQNLLLEFTFEKRLKVISKQINKEEYVCLFTDCETATNRALFINFFKRHLECAGIKTLLKNINEPLVSFIHNKDFQYITYFIYLIPLTIELQTDYDKKKIEILQIIEPIVKDQGNTNLLLLGTDDQIEILEELKNIGYISFKEGREYYSSFFKVLGKLIPSQEIRVITEEFLDEKEKIRNYSEASVSLSNQDYPIPLKSPAKSTFEFLRHRKRKLFFGVLASTIVFIIATFFLFSSHNEDQYILNNNFSDTFSLKSDLPIPMSSLSRNNLPQLLGGFNNEKIKTQAIIQKYALEMINESSLHTNKKYSVTNLESICLALKERIGILNDMEIVVRELRKEIKSKDSWFSNNKKYLKCIDELLSQIYKQKIYLEVNTSINEAIFQIQKGNYSGHLPGNEGALLCVVYARAKLEEYYKTYIRNAQKQTNPLATKSVNKDASIDELLQIEYLLQKIANLQGIIQKKQGEVAKNDHELIEHFNRALHSFKAVSNWEQEEKDERKSNVLSNIAFMLYGWVGDFQAANQLLEDAHRLDPHNPFILMHRALCFKEIAQSIKYGILPSNMKKPVITNTRTWQGLNKSYDYYKKAAEFFSNAATQVAEKNYLIRQINSQIILLQDPKANAEKAYKEFEIVEGYLKENILEISGGFDEYYYYHKARVFSALGKRKEALKSLMTSKMYLENANHTKNSEDPYLYIKVIVDFAIADLQQELPSEVPKCLELNIDGPLINIHRSLNLDPSLFTLKFKSFLINEDVKNIYTINKFDQNRNQKIMDSDEQITKRISNLFKIITEATSTNFTAKNFIAFSDGENRPPLLH